MHLYRTQIVEKARGDAEKVKLIGAAEATAIENIGRSEAEAMRLKAAAYKLYGEAATLSLVFEALPKVNSGTPWYGLSLRCCAKLSVLSVSVQIIVKHYSITGNFL